MGFSNFEDEYQKLLGGPVTSKDHSIILLNRKVNEIMATLDQIVADVAAEKTALASLGTFISGLQAQLKDALSGATISPANQAKIDQIFADVEANKAAIAAALTTNPPAPVPPTPGS